MRVATWLSHHFTRGEAEPAATIHRWVWDDWTPIKHTAADRLAFDLTFRVAVSNHVDWRHRNAENERRKYRRKQRLLGDLASDVGKDHRRYLGFPATIQPGAPVGDVSGAWRHHPGDDRRQRFRDSGDRAGAKPAQRRQLPDSVSVGGRPARRGAGDAAGRRQRGQLALVPRCRLVRRVDLLRRALLHVVHPPPGRHLAGPLLGRHARRLHPQPVARADLVDGRPELGAVGGHFRSAAIRRRRPWAR